MMPLSYDALLSVIYVPLGVSGINMSLKFPYKALFQPVCLLVVIFFISIFMATQQLSNLFYS